MEINWVQYQLDAYAANAKQVVEWLQNDALESDSIELALGLTATYLDIASKAKSGPDVSEVVIVLAVSLYRHIQPAGRWNTIAVLWPRLVEITQMLPCPELHAETVMQLAITKNNQGAVQEAQQLYERLIHSAIFYGLPVHQQVNVWHHLGVCYLRQGFYSQAKVAFQRCLKDADDQPAIAQYTEGRLHVEGVNRGVPAPSLWEIQAYALNQLGNIALFHGDFTQAHQYYQDSLALFNAHGEKDNLACVSYQSLGRLYVFQRKFALAIPVLQKGLAIRRRRHELEGTASNAVHLATAYLECDRLREAEPLLNEALRIYKELNDRQGVALCHLAFGRYALKQRQRREAVVHWQQSLDILATFQMPAIELQVLVLLLPQLLYLGHLREAQRYLIRFLDTLCKHNLNPIILCRLAFAFVLRLPDRKLLRAT